MEKIDLNNYEAYFLDFMEGTLSAEEKHDLFAFVELHPELKEEMESLDSDQEGTIALNPEAITFEDKALLKVDENTLILTANTVDEIMIASVEGQLSAAHEGQLLDYVKANALEEKLAYYKATILKPDMAVTYPEKGKLKVRTGLVISLPLIARFGAIAAVGIVLLTVAFRNWDGETPVVSDEMNLPIASYVRSNSIIDFTKVRGTNAVENVEIESTHEFNHAPRENVQILPDFVEENIVMDDPVELDTATANPNKWNATDDEGLNDVDVVKEDPKENPTIVPNEIDEIPDVVLASVRTEEPYKIVTNAASNIVKKDVKFTRDKDLKSNDYVAYSFKVGKFEFERKKSH